MRGEASLAGANELSLQSCNQVREATLRRAVWRFGECQLWGWREWRVVNRQFTVFHSIRKSCKREHGRYSSFSEQRNSVPGQEQDRTIPATFDMFALVEGVTLSVTEHALET